METRLSSTSIWKSKVLAALLLLLLCAAVGAAQTYTPLYTYSVNAGAYSGILPAGVMSQGRDGNLYTTVQNNGLLSRGTTFSMSLAGVPTTLYNFCSLNGWSQLTKMCAFTPLGKSQVVSVVSTIRESM